MMKLAQYISWSQIKSFGLALAVISLLFLFVFWSFRAGLVSIIPNLLPIIACFGLMGYLDIHLDIDTLLVAPIIIGIAVDDTIHFITHYRAEIVRHGNMNKAIINTFREAGQAVTFTSIILSIGFLIFIFSIHLGLRNFGIISSFAIFTALISDFFLLPRLCILFNVRFEKGAGRHNALRAS